MLVAALSGIGLGARAFGDPGLMLLRAHLDYDPQWDPFIGEDVHLEPAKVVQVDPGVPFGTTQVMFTASGQQIGVRTLPRAVAERWMADPDRQVESGNQAIRPHTGRPAWLRVLGSWLPLHASAIERPALTLAAFALYFVAITWPRDAAMGSLGREGEDAWLRAREASEDGRWEDVLDLLGADVRERADPGYGTAMDRLVIHALVALDELDRAHALLASPGFRGDAPRWRVLGHGAYYAGRLELAVEALEHAHALESGPAGGQDAFNIACCLARLDRPKEALPWLHRALDWGYGTHGEFEDDEDLAPLRESGALDSVLARARAGRPPSSPG